MSFELLNEVVEVCIKTVLEFKHDVVARKFFVSFFILMILNKKGKFGTSFYVRSCCGYDK